MNEELKNFMDGTYISNNYAAVELKDLNDISILIEKFDQGHKSIIILENGNFKGLIEQNTFRQNFHSRNIKMFTNFWLKYDEDEEKNRMNAVNVFLKTPLREIPLLENGKVISVVINNSTVGAMHRLNEVEFPPIYWNLISFPLASHFFKDKKILISSNYGSLDGFKKTFDDIAEIETYNEMNWNKYLDDYYDLFLYGSYAYIGGGYYLRKAFPILARHLYADMLSLEVVNYLLQNKVDFYLVRIEGKIKDLENRVNENMETVGNTPTILSKYADHLILKDMNKENLINIIGGHRITSDVPKDYYNSIYFFGPCTALGAFAADDKTIESFLQNLINEYNYPYRVVNCGSVGDGSGFNNDINSLYTVMDTEFKEGDIVFLFGVLIFNKFVEIPKERVINFSDIFNNPPFDTAKCFKDCAAHIDKIGNRIVAEVIFNHIKYKLKSNKRIRPFFERIKRQTKLDRELQEYLAFLSTEQVDKKNIGAVVMNCNPFTKGHKYLIEQALKLVDFLYVFVVEEDASEFTFKDRFAMVKENCKEFRNVKILPSGKYMISTFTFAEYFKKDELQDQNIMPAKDVRMFGSAIAPCLNIKFRFVGEEPFDNVTRQYNEVMKQILSEYGVELVEMPRFKLPSGEIVNATKVRTLLRENRLSECKQYLTEESYNYIINLG